MPEWQYDVIICYSKPRDQRGRTREFTIQTFEELAAIVAADPYRDEMDRIEIHPEFLLDPSADELQPGDDRY